MRHPLAISLTALCLCLAPAMAQDAPHAAVPPQAAGNSTGTPTGTPTGNAGNPQATASTPSPTKAGKPTETTLGEVVNTLRERITLSGYLQMGYTYEDDDESDPNTFEIKRAILIAKGKITDRWTLNFMFSLSGTSKVLDCYTEYRVLNHALTVRLGQFKPNFTIECPMSACDMELINRYSLATNYLCGVDGSDPLYGSNTGRDLGLMVHGDLLKGHLSYSLALMNGQGVNQKDKNDQKDVVGNLTVKPINALTLSGSFVIGHGHVVATSDVNPDLAVGDNYRRRRLAAGFKLLTKAIDLRSEYLAGWDDDVHSDGCYAVAAVHLPHKVDFIAGVDYFNKSHDLGDKQTDYAAGLQYWFYPKCRIQVQYSYCHRSLSDNYNLLQAQLQVRF